VLSRDGAKPPPSADFRCPKLLVQRSRKRESTEQSDSSNSLRLCFSIPSPPRSVHDIPSPLSSPLASRHVFPRRSPALSETSLSATPNHHPATLPAPDANAGRRSEDRASNPAERLPEAMELTCWAQDSAFLVCALSIRRHRSHPLRLYFRVIV
jgi:hypothetical protein